MSDTQSNAELTEVAAGGLRWVTMARLVTELVLLGSMVVLARLIPPAAFGAFALAVIVQELAINVPSEGIGSALVQRRTVEKRHLQAGFALSLVVGAVLGVVFLALAFLVVEPLFDRDTAELVALTAPWCLIGAVAAMPLAILRRNLDFKKLSLAALTQSVVRAAASIILAAGFGLDAEALVLGGIAGVAAMVAVALTLAPVPLPRWHTASVRDLLPYGGPAAAATLAWAGFRNGDYAIVGAKLGAAQAGFYWRGYQLAVEYQGKISQIMAQMAFPVLSRTADPNAMFELRRRMTRLVTVVVFPMLACLAIVAPVLIPWAFGANWDPAVLPTQILAGAGAATVVIDAVGAVLMAAGRSRAMLGYGVAHFAVYAAAVVFAARWGLTGVSVAAVVVHGAFVVVAYQMLLRGRADRTLRFLWDDIRAAATSGAVLLAVCWPVTRALDGRVPAPLHLAFVIALAGAVYLAVLQLCFREEAGDLNRLLRRVLPLERLGWKQQHTPSVGEA